jgi:hypothetical protein
MSEWPQSSPVDRNAFRAARIAEIFREFEPLTPKEYIGIELCRRGFANANGKSFVPPPPSPVRAVVVGAAEIGPRRPGCLQRQESGQMFFELLSAPAGEASA